MIVTMISMWMMKVTIYKVIDVISMWDGFVTTAWPVHMGTVVT